MAQLSHDVRQRHRDPGRRQDVPAYHVTGWYDSWGTQVANMNYVQLSKTKKSLQRLIVGPWTHGGQEVSYAGIAEFGDAAAINMNALRKRWFDRWLLGVENGGTANRRCGSS